jgi:amino acid transporter
MATPAQGAAGRKLSRDVSLLGLMFVLLGSIIGSGWLFGALYASQIAGPAAIIARVALSSATSDFSAEILFARFCEVLRAA